MSETRRVSFQNKFEKLVHIVGFMIRKESNAVSGFFRWGEGGDGPNAAVRNAPVLLVPRVGLA
jgi:hypothetical protein